MRRLLTLWLIMAVGMLVTVGTVVVETVAAKPQDVSSEEEPSEDADRSYFKFPLSAKGGGGQVEVWAGDFEYEDGEYMLATDGVRIQYRDLQLQADEIRVDIPANVVTAQGSVVLDEGPQRLVGETLEYDLTTRTGKVTEATAYVDNSYVFKGDEISKIADATYGLDNGMFTSCSEDNPPWSLHMSQAEITLDDYARVKNARMKFGKVPVFYVPYMVWPTKTERSSGLLIPQPGYSTRRGFELGMAYYKTLGRSADTTFFLDLSTEEYFGVGNEFRYNTGKSEGHFEAYLLQDQDAKLLRDLVDNEVMDANGDLLVTVPTGFELPEETRWKANWFHETKDFWGGFRGVIKLQDFSDASYRQDFERSTGRQSNSFIYSEAYLSHNFGQQSLNIKLDLRERIQTMRIIRPDGVDTRDQRLGRVIDTRRQLPEIEYRLRPTQLGGTPIYFSLDANAHYLSIENSRYSPRDESGGLIGGEISAVEYGRLDLFPNFSIPLSTLPWLSAKVDLGGRATHYTNSVDTDSPNFTAARFPLNESDESLTRTFGIAGVEIVGPSFSRIFEKKKPGRFSKLKHIVEPRIDYAYVDDFADPKLDGANNPILAPDGLPLTEQDEVPLFDEIDNRRLRNEATLSLFNRILAKPTDEEEGGAFEILSLEISRAFSFDDDKTLQVGLPDPINPTGPIRTKEGPIRTILRYNPTQDTSFKAEARYNTINSGLQSMSLSGGFKIGRQGFGGSLFKNWNPRLDTVSSEQLRVFTSLSFIPDRLTFDANLSFDLNLDDTDLRSNPLQQRYFLSYTGSCYTLQFEYRESTFGQVEDKDFRLLFTLRNVGTFIDMNGSVN